MAGARVVVRGRRGGGLLRASLGSIAGWIIGQVVAVIVSLIMARALAMSVAEVIATHIVANAVPHIVRRYGVTGPMASVRRRRRRAVVGRPVRRRTARQAMRHARRREALHRQRQRHEPHEEKAPDRSHGGTLADLPACQGLAARRAGAHAQQVAHRYERKGRVRPSRPTSSTS